MANFVNLIKMKSLKKNSPLCFRIHRICDNYVHFKFYYAMPLTSLMYVWVLMSVYYVFFHYDVNYIHLWEVKISYADFLL
jgi:hypothetical protein